jgi:lipopolysaccharide heptosyltransferase I
VTPPASILIVRLSAIGDVIHSLPVLDALRTALPSARIGWLVEELSAPLLQNHPQLDKLYVIPKKRWRGRWLASFRSEIRPFFGAIRADGWDATLDMQGLSKSGLAALGAGGKLRVGFGGANAREINALLSNRRVRPQPTDRHVVQQNLRLIEGLGLSVPTEPPRGIIGILPEEQAAMREKLTAAGWNGERLVAINPGAGWSSKRWSPASFGELAKLLAHQTGMRPLVLWGPGEEAWRDEIAAVIGPSHLIAPPTRIRELAVLISLTSLMVGGDTGPTHMAGPLGVPVISIFGASDGHRNRPWPPTAGIMVQQEDLPCVPCWKTVCPLEGSANLQCLHTLTAAAVMERVTPWLRTAVVR